jgi:hypothetical protein
MSIISVTVDVPNNETLWTFNCDILDPGDPGNWSIDGNPAISFDPGDGPNSIRVYTGSTPHVGDGAVLLNDPPSAVFGAPSPDPEYDATVA